MLTHLAFHLPDIFVGVGVFARVSGKGISRKRTNSWIGDFMEESEVKIVIGEAAGRVYLLDHTERALPMLHRLFEEPTRSNIERAASDLLSSNNPDEHAVGFILQAALQGDLSSATAKTLNVIAPQSSLTPLD
jgi:hypothetical protein